MQIQAHYTEAIIRRTTLRFWRRYIAWHGFAAVALMGACLLYLVAIGDYSWYVCVMGTILALGC